MLTIEVGSEEEDEGVSEEVKCSATTAVPSCEVQSSALHCSEDTPHRTESQDGTNTTPRSGAKSHHAVKRHNSVEKFQAAVTKVKLGMRVVRSIQFHTSRTVARAIDVEQGDRATTTRRKSRGFRTGDLGHFPAVLRLLCRSVRPSEQCYLVVELVSPRPESLLQYFVVLRHTNDDGLKEDMILGVQVTVEDNILGDLEFCVGFPITSKTTAILEDGDGSFTISDSRKSLIMKPANIQSQWAAIQFLTGSLQNAVDNMYFPLVSSHQWCSHYLELINNNQQSDGKLWKITTIPLKSRKSILEIFDKRNQSADTLDQLREGMTTGISSTKSVIGADTETISQIRSLDEQSKLLLKTIREIMYSIDLDDASSKSIRTEMESRLGIDLTHHKTFIEEKILMTLGQMDQPSLIKDYLYLGTEWNACNYDELIENGITHVLNVTTEIESCFESSFKYHRVDVLDIPRVNLLREWEKTHRFIKNCKESNGKVLVHCQRGISRSGSTTISYIMREYGMSELDASSFVKGRRACVKPNRGFQKQLEYYGKCLTEHVGNEEALTRALESADIGELYGLGAQ